ncbi:hypothetical protein MPTK1_1g17880 [Marchantia polymorpha subsp. ruderalis]|uniref:PHD-type domain-containing protein n=2 Tax=Marchantia polymorpha TaxID=3197 RepID=A0AAF6ARC8_MARPO|nr:hypothetical protein MARPO_0001s0127 [Marchantia polymorpha]BBM98998.1 hypothetical protein Mp_1g17880 [Marchantia polymorpha subsp. ruderalis]|eukprot:PTQ50074.1 hypothetical protein MARPO_0001s0127 [Marchantia polymorpha]
MARNSSRKKRRKSRELNAKATSSSDSEGGSEDDHEEEDRNERRWQTRKSVIDSKAKGKEVVKDEDEESRSASGGVVEEQKGDSQKEADQVCGICLSEGGIERGKLDCCDHFFCFNCIMEWAKVESRCPMCKQRFVTVMRPAASGVARSRNRTFRIPTRDQVYEPSEEEIRLFTDPYQNTVCIECQEAGDEGLLLLCDRCDAAAHTYCVGLGRSVPRGDWFCQECLNGLAGSSEDEEEVRYLVQDGEDPCGTNSAWDLAVLVTDINAERNARSRRLATSNQGARPVRRSTRRMERGPRATTNLLESSSTDSRSGFLPSLLEHYGVARTLFRQRQVQATVHNRLQNMRDNWNRFRTGETQFSGQAAHESRNSNFFRTGPDVSSVPSSSLSGTLGLGTRNIVAPGIGRGDGPSVPHPRPEPRSAEQVEVDRAWAMMDQARRLEVRSAANGNQSATASSRGGIATERFSREAKSQEVAVPRTREIQAQEAVLPGATSSSGGQEVFLNTRSANLNREVETKESTAPPMSAREDNPLHSSSRREVSSSRGGYHLRESSQVARNTAKDNSAPDSSSRRLSLRENRVDPEALQVRSVLDDKDNSRGSSGRSTRMKDPNKDSKDSTALQVLSLFDDKDNSRGSGPSTRRRESNRESKDSTSSQILSTSRTRAAKAIIRCPERDEEVKLLKEQCFNLVNMALKPFFDKGKIDKKQYKEIARLATHAILASLDGPESKNGTNVSLGTVICDHEGLTSSDLIPGCCESCVLRHVRKFVKKIVKEKVDC